MIDLVENVDPGARIKVIGAGGCGGNANTLPQRQARSEAQGHQMEPPRAGTAHGHTTPAGTAAHAGPRRILRMARDIGHQCGQCRPCTLDQHLTE